MKRAVFLCLALMFVGSCAQWPSGGGGAGGLRLTFSMTMSGDINPNYVYFVAFNPSIDDIPIVQGPIPVIAPPWGNGFVAGNATHFMRWDDFQSPKYQIYAFLNPTLLDFFAVGVPVQELPVGPGSREIRFEIELSQIAGTTPPENLKSLQLNFLTMNVVPQGSTGDKVWDALGNGAVPSEINDYVTIPLRVGIYNNATFQFREPSGDCIDPGLDIVDWQVEIRN